MGSHDHPKLWKPNPTSKDATVKKYNAFLTLVQGLYPPADVAAGTDYLSLMAAAITSMDTSLTFTNMNNAITAYNKSKTKANRATMNNAESLYSKQLQFIVADKIRLAYNTMSPVGRNYYPYKVFHGDRNTEDWDSPKWINQIDWLTTRFVAGQSAVYSKKNERKVLDAYVSASTKAAKVNDALQLIASTDLDAIGTPRTGKVSRQRSSNDYSVDYLARLLTWPQEDLIRKQECDGETDFIGAAPPDYYNVDPDPDMSIDSLSSVSNKINAQGIFSIFCRSCSS